MQKCAEESRDEDDENETQQDGQVVEDADGGRCSVLHLSEVVDEDWSADPEVQNSPDDPAYDSENVDVCTSDTLEPSK